MTRERKIGPPSRGQVAHQRRRDKAVIVGPDGVLARDLFGAPVLQDAALFPPQRMTTVGGAPAPGSRTATSRTPRGGRFRWRRNRKLRGAR